MRHGAQISQGGGGDAEKGAVFWDQPGLERISPTLSCTVTFILSLNEAFESGCEKI